MNWRKIVCIIITLLICFSASSFYIAPAAAVEYNFSERIVYGGTALDVGDYIYYANSDDGSKLYRRLSNNNESMLIYPAPVGYLNFLDGNIYFISENKIVSINLTGENEYILFKSEYEIKDLYVASDCIYFLCQGEILKLQNGKIKSVFYAEALCAFLPINENEFQWYTENPEYIEIDQSGNEIYTETKEKYLTYIYNTITDVSNTTISSFSSLTTQESSYTGPYVQLDNVTLPLAEYMPGSFFSKNGKACTCHYDSKIDCIASLENCNCMRYWPTGEKSTCEVDLLGAQCFAFARFIFYKSFGFIDHAYYNPGKFYSVGSIESGAVTGASIKELLMKAATGAHVRLSRGHSVSILTMDEDFIVVYHANAGGDGITFQPCVVSTRRFTWNEFANFAVAGVDYVNMPYNYPVNVKVISKINVPGYYKLTDNLKVRTGPGIEHSYIGILSAGSYVNVLEVDGDWGRIEYNGGNNYWISLNYATFYTLSTITPSSDSVFYLDNNRNYLICDTDQHDYLDLISGFSNQRITAFDKYGNALSESDYICTGSVIKIEVNGNIIDSKTVIICGDANGNGSIDAGDYLITKRLFLGTYTTEGSYLLAADINRDSVIDSKDYFYIKRYLTGASESLI